jgi:ABC-2 type transport system permease protein
MMGPFRSELRKLTTVRTTAVLTLAGWALLVLGSLFLLFSNIDDETGMPTFGGAFTGSATDVAGVIDQIGGSSIIVLVIGLLLVTTEVRHQTIGRTLQLTPSRTRVLGAKLAAGLAYAAAFFLGGLLIVGVLLAIGAAAEGVGLSYGPEVGTALWHGVAGLGLTAVFGVAIGALLRSQVVAITLTLVWVFVVENLVRAFVPSVGRWLPLQAQQAVFVSQELRDSVPEGALDLLEPAVGLAVFLGYVVVALAAAAVLLRVRDV